MPRSLSLLFVSSLLSTTAWADCNSMFALNLKEANGLTSCTSGTVSCDSDYDGLSDDLCTANEFRDLIYDKPLQQEIDGGILPTDAPGTGNLFAAVLPKCANGTNDCPGAELRCVDGTRPLYWVNPANEASDKWVFTFQGGGSCGRSSGLQGGERCWTSYTEERDSGALKNRAEMTNWLVSQTGVLEGPDLVKTGHGILRADASSPFAQDYHRVFLSKCAFDRFNGRAMVTGNSPASCPAGLDCTNQTIDPDTSGLPENGDGDSFELHFTGRAQIAAVFNDLRDGRDIHNWKQNAAVLSLPPLEDATQIVVAGHSGGAEGLIHNLDDISAFFDVWDPEIDVRGVIDARGWPSLNHQQGRRHGTDMYAQNGGFALDCTPSASFDCLPPDTSGADTSYTPNVFRVGSDDRVASTYRRMLRDASCAATVPWFQNYRCHDTGHVLFNHLSTPFFMRQALQDSKHTDTRSPKFAVSSDYRWVPSEYEDQVRSQIAVFEAERHSSPGRFVEAAYGWADPSDVGLGLFMPISTSHEGLFDDDEFTNVEMANTVVCAVRTNYEDALHDWLSPSNGDELHVSGLFGTTCP